MKTRFAGVVLVAIAALVALYQLPAGQTPSPSGGTEPDFGIDIAAPAEPHHERPKNPPADSALIAALPRQAAGFFSIGPYVSIQVNVDQDGNDVLGDAANEPSIAVDPTDPQRMVIGWRQFDSTTSNFKYAGVGHSHDGGTTWTTDVLDPGAFRTDPVVAADGFGNFYYSSLVCNDFPTCSSIRVHVFKSADGGVTWPLMTDSFGGDKQWFTIDERISGQGAGHIYQYWTATLSCCPPNNFTRSTDGGASFEAPIALPSPGAKWGTLDVAPDGTLFLAGATANVFEHVVMRSQLASNPSFSPFFDLVQTVDLGGYTVGLAGAQSPNPVGLMGQVWIAIDPVNTDVVYTLGSVRPPDGDPLDVHFVRSDDGGQTWSEPIAVNDNAGDKTWQWFGMMSIAPNGRLDAIWNDTRASPGDPGLSQLFYSQSFDGGITWSANVPLTPVFDSHLGFPQESKIGDYNHMLSDNEGVDVAFAATFNGGQDVYYMRVPATTDPPPTDDIGEEPNGVIKNRFISFQMPVTDDPQVTAIRVQLVSLHHPPSPANAPDFSGNEGEYRYVRLFRDGSDNPVFSCPDSDVHNTSFNCATLGCQPEYRDWPGEFGGQVLHVTGSAVVPSSVYHVSLVPDACMGIETQCPSATTGIAVATAQWGDILPGSLNVLDIAAQVDKVKDLVNANPEHRCLIRSNEPAPLIVAVNVIDIALTVDALKNLPYPYSGSAGCP